MNTWLPCCGRILGSLNFQISVGAMAVVLDKVMDILPGCIITCFQGKIIREFIADG